MREHEPIRLESFNGLYNRGTIVDTPLDHFSECWNLKFIGDNAFGSRDGIGLHQSLATPTQNILRIYNYPTADKQTLLVLTTGGKIYHVVDGLTVFGPILTIANMTDFGFVPYAGRAYITPFTTALVDELNRERGLQSEFLYVYKGDGTAARKAAGAGPTTALVPANGAAGYTDAGVHIFGYVFETDTGYLSAPGGLVAFTTGAALSVSFTGVAVSPLAHVTKRHIVASKVIQTYNGDVNGYQLFFIPGATIPNNTGTVLANQSFFDADLLLDASHLTDNFAEIPAGVGLCTYHNRLVTYCDYNNVSLGYASAVGEPEAINQIDGVLLMPPDGNPITNAAEMRDVLYFFKRNKTGSFVDNGQEPAFWPYSGVDNAMGCGVHGIATVVDAGSSNIDYLLVASYKGVTLFNGRYILPELTWKIQTRWLQNEFKTKNRIIQMVNDSVNQLLYIVMTDRTVMFGNYANGFDPKSIRWCPWTFEISDNNSVYVNTLALVNVSELIFGCDQV
jgi:hypothetical protein